MRKSWAALCLLAACGSHSQAQDKLSGENSIHDSLTIQEVVVTGKHSTLGANHVQQQLGSTAITRSMGKSLASLLENISGMSSIQTGTIVAKPVIHGMYGNRILLMSNGARLTGQQWGSDHAPEVDKNGYANIEVVKGAESVKYGSEALGGIVLMNQSPLPYGQQEVNGKVSTLYGSNGRRFSLSGYAEGTMPWNRRLAWRVHANWENGGDRSTAHYLLNNTGLRENDAAVNLGYDWGQWRTELGYSYFSQKLGVMQSAQMGSEELLQERVRLGQPVSFTPFSRKIGYPHQKIDHHTAFAKISLNSEALGNFIWQTTYQKDDRRENRIRRMNHSDIPTVSLRLQSLQNTLTWKKPYNAWQSEGGLQFIYTENHSERGTGVVPIIPNYTELAGGAYFLQKLTHDSWGVEAGLRGDLQRTEADGYDWTGRRYGGKRNFYNLTYSLGAHYRPDRHWTMTTNFGVAWRAPHVYELYSNGNELSSGMFVKGDSTLRSEQSYKWIASLQYSHPVLNVRLDAYLQWINNYIYDQPTRRRVSCFPVPTDPRLLPRRRPRPAPATRAATRLSRRDGPHLGQRAHHPQLPALHSQHAADPFAQLDAAGQGRLHAPRQPHPPLRSQADALQRGHRPRRLHPLGLPPARIRGRCRLAAAIPADTAADAGGRQSAQQRVQGIHQPQPILRPRHGPRHPLHRHMDVLKHPFQPEFIII